MKISSDRIHSHFLTTLIHFISQLAHVGFAIFFTTQWHEIISICPAIGHVLTSVFGTLTGIYAALSTAKGYALLTHFCDEPWAKRTLSVLSMATSSTSAVLACGSLVLLELEVSGNTSACATDLTTDDIPLLPSRIFLVVSALLNIIFFATSFFLHWRQGRIDALESGERSKIIPHLHPHLFPAFPP